ncbi:hypothetical protein [Epilithonimonas hispanica]|uniref:Uncharacterized protein n=1 Tax=Epilithonimonas hispanica TaxID=358687 RepID=A0A3D9CJX1_9FLAO|nr:hypothetical protein [Epilithonimonas hispanica]REC66034.1 hypothetical protein DRF58_17160 [Epilithonimonas hispanica]
MNFKNPKYIVFGIITFVIIFLMNFLGSDAPDKLYRAILTASVSVVGLLLGLWIYSKRDQNDERNNFD